MLFRNNAAICGRFFKEPLGVLKKGAIADIIVADYEAPTPVNGRKLPFAYPFRADGAERFRHHDRRPVCDARP
jgi:cytosine/adenosine deaminase-related metal-dependent hydrolase